MVEYIKREDAIDLFWTVDTENNGDDGYTVVIKFGRCYDSNEIEALLSKLPAADVAEVRHGRWVDKTDISRAAVEQRVDCSVCGQIFWTMSALLFNYCPNCGARMDEEDEHETS